jgi:hypothetical protein
LGDYVEVMVPDFRAGTARNAVTYSDADQPAANTSGSHLRMAVQVKEVSMPRRHSTRTRALVSVCIS